MAKRVNSKQKGSRYELRIKKRFKDLGYDNCITTRQGSRELDSKKIDLMNIPYLVQCKNVSRPINYKKLYEEIKDHNRESDLPILIFHKRENGTNTSFVIIEENDFFKLLDNEQNNKISEPSNK